MTERVVHELEPVEIEEHHDRRVAAPAVHQFDRVVQSIDEQLTVGESRQRIVERLVRQLSLDLFFGFAGCARHPDRDREHECAEETDCLGVRSRHQRGRPADEDHRLANGAPCYRPSQRGPPGCRARLLEVGKRGEGVGHSELGAPARHVDDRGHRRRVCAHAQMQPKCAGLGVDPAVDEPTREDGAGEADDVAPNRGVGHDVKRAQH